MRVVLFTTNGPLYLSDFKQLEKRWSGYVENGCWGFKYDPLTRVVSAYEGRTFVTSFSLTAEPILVVIPPEVRGGYNEVIAWAETNQKELTNG